MRRFTRSHRERGAALVEFTIVSMLLVIFGFGIIEFGLGWQDRLTVQTAARAGVRVGSSLTTNSLADYNILAAVNSSLHDVGASNIEYVVVYKSTTTDGKVPTLCSGTVPISVATVCNVYTGAQMAALNSSQFGCGLGDLDLAWCPTTRINLLASGPDYLGVWIKVKHTMVGKLYSNPVRITDSAVMRLEPLT